jgi:hypothetical protein
MQRVISGATLLVAAALPLASITAVVAGTDAGIAEGIAPATATKPASSQGGAPHAPSRPPAIALF